MGSSGEKRGEINLFEGRNVQSLMHEYYAKLFPYREIYEWLVYGNDSKNPQADSSYFSRREICFTLDGDIFVRYQSYKSAQEFGAAVRSRCPAKIDIGPVYTVNPQERLKYGSYFGPDARELVFDVDLTDYDDVRSCGDGAHVCTRCWPLMSAAIKLLDNGLRNAFGFKHILYVFSGRRGVHAWICDTAARHLTDEERSAIASWFGIFKGHDEGRAKLSLSYGGIADQHPAVKQAYDILYPVWIEKILPGQRVFQDPKLFQVIMKLVPDPAVAERIRARVKTLEGDEEEEGGGGRKGKGGEISGSFKVDKDLSKMLAAGNDINVAKWKIYEMELKRASEASTGSTAVALRRCLLEAVFSFCYPRLDMEVTRKRNHLLKAPFCIHPKTGKVCVPLDPETVDNFDPDDVPTIYSLLTELRLKAPLKIVEKEGEQDGKEKEEEEKEEEEKNKRKEKGKEEGEGNDDEDKDDESDRKKRFKGESDDSCELKKQDESSTKNTQMMSVSSSSSSKKSDSNSENYNSSLKSNSSNFGSNNEKDPLAPWRRTRMAEAVEYFEREFLEPLQKTNRQEMLQKTRAQVQLNQLKLEF
uniref:DNA primase n=1 Tax=Polytomella parva TaxID=51329 RepID=A0A7S0UQK9_9CHLO|mmetsp:Transcript_17848/g.32590  ORF Transcript_17848/g.32590 Transcript_17848/m.32590 type:complete len:586 (+) Transcript_17848:73-1830(+)